MRTEKKKYKYKRLTLCVTITPVPAVFYATITIGQMLLRTKAKPQERRLDTDLLVWRLCPICAAV
jgi:hypothetical protein